MSKLNQIQSKLRELDGGAFQKLADAYLHKKGYENINPLGSVIGANKVKKGTPDTYLRQSDNKFIFVEYTTQPSGLFGKLKKDLGKCLDESKTGIPVSEIKEIVFCHTSTLEPAEQKTLADTCQRNGVNLNIFGLGPISFDLYQKYPGLAKDLLGVEVDTAQIVTVDEFVELYGKNPLATSLSTTFQFRENEVKEVLEGLEQYNLVLLSGKPGVGKSRLALECCDSFVKSNPDYQVRCIFNLGPDLFQDLQVYFSNTGKYLIFVDDANRLNRFEYVLQILQKKRNDQEVKIIATVRDYALDKVREVVQPYGFKKEVEVKLFEEKQVKQLVEREYGIKNPIYLDRISDIAKGNPRLAMMAAHIAKEANNLQSISDVSTLYDEYFSSIRKDLEGFGGKEIVKIAGIVAFLQIIDRSNEKLIDAIEAAFGIPPSNLWQGVQRLHEHEILDVYEDEVARTSDQVLSSYLFYLAFFKQRVLDFSNILKHFFPQFKQKLIDAINPVLNAFDRHEIMDVMRPHVEKYWNKLEAEDKQEELMELVNTFWFLKQTDTLLYIQKVIADMEREEQDISTIKFEANSGSSDTPVLRVLELFQYSDEDNFTIAVNLIFGFADKQHNKIPSVLHTLIEDFGFRHDSYRYGFSIQRIVLGELWKRAKFGDDEIFARLFITVAKEFVKIHYRDLEFKGGNTFTTYDFDLPPTPEVFELRKELWEFLLSLYDKPQLQHYILGAIQNYDSDFYRVSDTQIIEKDSEQLLPFFRESLSPEVYIHCVLVNEYLDLLDMKKVDYEKTWREEFKSETYIISELLLSDSFGRRNLGMNYDEYEQYRKESIKEYFAGYKLLDYKNLFEHVVEIQQNLEDSKRFQLHNSFELVLIKLSNQDLDLFVNVLEYYLELGEPLRLHWVLSVVYQLVQKLGFEDSLRVITKHDYATQKAWVFAAFQVLQGKQIMPVHLEKLYALYSRAQPEDIPQDFNYLLNYRKLDEKVIPKVVKIIIAKTQENPRYAYTLSPLFNGYTEVGKNLFSLFVGELDVLEAAYLGALEASRHDDYKGSIFTQILDVDPQFAIKYLNKLYNIDERISSHGNDRDYSFIWLRDNYREIMTGVAEFIFEKEKESFGFWFTYLRSFFLMREGDKENNTIELRQSDFLSNVIKERCFDKEFMDYVFSLISELAPDRRKQFISTFLSNNQNIEDFKRLSIEPNHWSYMGSMVPVLQNRVEFFESLLPLLNTVDFLAHKQYIEHKISSLRLEIEREKKDNFMKD
jgi:DNA polymerase III delta prime subunit